MTILDRCKQITDTESGRVLLYRDEVEAVLTAGDTISRRQAIDALGDEPEVWSGKDEYAQGLNNQWHYDRNAIKALPSAQPEIIRCKDCEYWREDHTCREHSLVSPMAANEFCSRAERREE